jgi:hypothetical protein
MNNLFEENEVLHFKRIEDILNLNPVRSLIEEKEEAISLFRNKYLYEVLKLVPFKFDISSYYLFGNYKKIV